MDFVGKSVQYHELWDDALVTRAATITYIVNTNVAHLVVFTHDSGIKDVFNVAKSDDAEAGCYTELPST